MQDDEGYQACYTATVNYFHRLSDQHSNITFLDFTQLSGIEGVATEEGFYDSQHMTEANSRLLIDHAAEALLQAYHSQGAS